jgi:predicted transposase/invertase (TIGR01784 family)
MSATEGQTFGIPTHDALFKFILSDDDVRTSFLNAFITGTKITGSTRIDDQMQPLKNFELLRNFVHDKENVAVAKCIVSAPESHFDQFEPRWSSSIPNVKALKFVKALAGHFGDLQKAFPAASYSGTMDFSCQLDDGNFALVEMQVIPQDSWDQRALAYLANFYGSQLRKGSRWVDVKKVIAINILGGGLQDRAHWRDTPDQFRRHYKLQDQLNQSSPARFIEGIELFQYSVMNAPDVTDLPSSLNRETQDWLTFFKRAARMDEEGVKQQIVTVAVKKAFQMATLSSLPSLIKTKYDEEDASYRRVSRYTAERFLEGQAEGEAKGRAEGEAMGRAEGKAMGRAEGEAMGRAEGEAMGRAEGEAKIRLQAARKLKLEMKMTDLEIAGILELTEAEVSVMKLDK